MLLEHQGKNVKPEEKVVPQKMPSADHFVNGYALEGLTSVLKAGNIFLSSINGGHVLIVRGAVVNLLGKAVRAICNDPQGTLAGPDSDKVWYDDSENEINESGKMDTNSSKLGEHVYYLGNMKTKKFCTTQKYNEAFNFDYDHNTEMSVTIIDSIITRDYMQGKKIVLSG
jgi:hypothetical protein